VDHFDNAHKMPIFGFDQFINQQQGKDGG